MINPDFTRTMSKCFRSSLQEAMGHSFKGMRQEIRSAQNDHHFGDESIVLTVSSHMFKIIVVLDFDLKSAEGQVAKMGNNRGQNDQTEHCRDYLLELTNYFCGEIKRRLLAFERYVGKWHLENQRELLRA